MATRIYFDCTPDINFDPGVSIHVNRYHENHKSLQHTHDFPEINYVAEGKGFHYIDDEILPVSSGDIFVIPVGTSHVYRPSSASYNDALVVYNCVFPTDQLAEWCKQIPLPFEVDLLFARSNQHYYHYHEQRHETKAIFERMWKEFIQHRPGYRALLVTQVIELLVQLYRFENAYQETYIPSNRLDPVFGFIGMNYHEPLTLEQMAGIVYMSPNHFHRLFKKTTGQTFIEYLQNVRIEESCTLLMNTSLKVRDIANQVGYHDIQFFYRLFKRKMGITPRDYRNGLKPILHH